MFKGNEFQAELQKVIPVAVNEDDAIVRGCELHFKLQLDSAMAKHLDGGQQAFKFLNDCSWDQGPVIAKDSRIYTLEFLEGETGNKVARKLTGCRRTKAVIKQKRLEKGDRTLLEFVVEFKWRKGQLEWCAEQLRTTPRLRMTLEQTELSVA